MSFSVDMTIADDNYNPKKTELVGSLSVRERSDANIQLLLPVYKQGETARVITISRADWNKLVRVFP